MQCRIDKLVYGGLGMGRLASGKVCFVPNSLPGEIVTVSVRKETAKLVHATPIGWVNRSHLRQIPPCPHYLQCGGCHYQHTTYAEELRAKQEQVSSCFKPWESRLAEIVPSSSEYRYRNHISLHKISDSTSGFMPSSAVASGVKKKKPLPVAVRDCLLVKEDLEPVFHEPWNNDDIHTKRVKTAGGSSQHKPTAVRRTWRLSSNGRYFGDHQPEQALYPLAIGNALLWSSASCFMQANIDITLKVARTLQHYCSLSHATVWMDLFCGVGTFSVLLAAEKGLPPRVKRVVCVENNIHCLKPLSRNIEGIQNNSPSLTVECHSENAERWYDPPVDGKSEPTFLFVDPPRAGLSPSLLAAISRDKSIETLAYLSCHMGTLQRDLRHLTLQNDSSTHPSLQLVYLQAFDMFPRTKHVEVLAILSRGS